jgi:SAM-dependent methyltransferase
MPDDALGTAVRDYYEGRYEGQCVYRDGEETRPFPVSLFFEQPAEWPSSLRRLVASLDPPLLDVGCGAGRHALAVQSRGPVVAVDASPAAVKTARARGVDRVAVMDMFDLAVGSGAFETVLVDGTQTGLAGDLDGVSAFLSDLAAVTTDAGEAVVDSYDPTRTDADDLFGYRPTAGDGLARRRFRVTYRDLRGPPLDFLLFSPERLREATAGTPWRVGEVLRGAGDGGYYKARLRK